MPPIEIIFHREVLLKENARMKAALEKIASEQTQWDWTDLDSAQDALKKIAVQMRQVARAALGE